MKTPLRALLLLILCACSLLGSVHAQEAYRAIYEAKGTEGEFKRTLDGEKPTPPPPYVIIVDIAADRYLSYHRGQMLFDSVYYAEMQLTHDAMASVKKARGYKRQGVTTFVDSRLGASQRIATQVIGNAYYQYTEDLQRPDWQIDESATHQRSGYNCLKATADYLGRTWTVYFTPDIPTPAGPWKLWGLPGLIVEASESEGLFSFSLSSFGQITPDQLRFAFEERIASKNLFKESKENVLKLSKFFITDPTGYLQKIKGVSIKAATSSDGSPINLNEFKRDYTPIEQ